MNKRFGCFPFHLLVVIVIGGLKSLETGFPSLKICHSISAHTYAHPHMRKNKKTKNKTKQDKTTTKAFCIMVSGHLPDTNFLPNGIVSPHDRSLTNSVFLSAIIKFQIGFAATDAVTTLKLIETGIPKERLALLAVPMVPLQIVLPWIISKYTAGPKPLSVFLKAMPFR